MNAAASLDRRADERAESDDGRQFVTFALNEQVYCLDILSVREIRMLESVTPVPGAPEAIRGVFNLRGSIVPVCDLRLRFGQAATPIAPNHPAVIVAIQDRLIGLLVDEVLDIVTVPSDNVCPPPDAESGRRNPFFSALITQPNGLLIVVDVDRLADLRADAGEHRADGDREAPLSREEDASPVPAVEITGGTPR